MICGCRRDMGCGRSRHHSASKIDDNDNDSKDNNRKKSQNKQDKKENKDPVKPLNPKGGSAAKTDKVTNKKSADRILDSPTKSRPWMNGSSQSPKLETKNNGLKPDKYSNESKSKAGFKDRNYTGGKPNAQITGSQLEFFRMLDERIEQGRDYGDD